MQLTPERLSQHLQSGLRPLYWIAGDEPLQTMEAADAVRQAARAAGYDERSVLGGDGEFKWETLLQEAGSMSLFASRRLLELRLPSAKPGKEGAQVLTSYLAELPQDVVLLVVSGKLDKAAKNANWFKALDSQGVVVQTWPLDRGRMQQWLARRAAGLGLGLSAASVGLLIERTEGNLLAAAQELEKLRLLHGATVLDDAQVARAVADSARFNVYDLADAALEGDAPRALRILQGLREEGQEPVLILWAVVRELRSLAQLAAVQARGLSPAAALQAAGVWKQRVPLVQAAARRKTHWAGLLQRAGELDRLIKGQTASVGSGQFWLEMEQLLLAFAGKSLFSRELMA